MQNLLAWSLGLSLLLAFALMSTGVIVSLRKRFDGLEQREILLQIDRVSGVLQNQMESFHPIIKDWAEWDDMYFFIQKPSRSFIKSNLYPEVLDQIAIDSFRVYNLQGHLIFSLDRTAKDGLKDLSRILNQLTLDDHVLPDPKEREPKAGLWFHEGVLFRYTVLPARDSKTEKMPSGYVVFFKKIDTTLEQKIQSLAKTNLKISLLDDGMMGRVSSKLLPKKLRKILTKKSSKVSENFIQRHAWIHASAGETQVGLVAQDSKGQDRMLFTFPIERVLRREGDRMVEGMIYAFLGVAILVLAVQMSLVRSIIGRLRDLVRQIEALSRQHIPGQRLIAQGRDELLSLASSFNGLLDVVDRNQANMRIILENVRSGFLIASPQGHVFEGATKLACEIFQKERLEGEDLAMLLCESEADQGHFISMYEQIFDPDIPLELSLGQMPERYRVGERNLEVDFVPLFDLEGRVYAVVCTLHDVTHLDEVAYENESNQALIKILRNRGSFQSLLEDMRHNLASCRVTLDTSEPQAAQRLTRRVVHTMKGNLAIFGLNTLVRLIHDIEERRIITRFDIDELEGALLSFLRAHYAILEADYETTWDPVYRVTQHQLGEFLESTEHWQDIRQARLEAEGFATHIKSSPISQLLAPLLEDARKLAKKEGKKLQTDIEGGDILLDGERFKALLKNLVHAFRNTVAHGLEKPAERGAKPEFGMLIVRVHKGDMLILTIEDDGRGIDTEKLKARAIARQLITREEAATMSYEKALELIFADGLSTVSEANEIAGRGVGMSALRDAVHSLGGQIQLDSQKGYGTTLRLIFPLAMQMAA